ncbi:MAG: hypothetical protein Q9163_000255 [Psora crenata]
MHIDHNQEERILVYDYFRDTLLALIKDHPDFPTEERKKILRLTGEAVQELHANDWIHIDLLLLDDWKELEESGIDPEQEIMIRHFLYFGPLPGGLLDQVNDEGWNFFLKKASEVAEMAAKDRPGAKFEQWGEELGPEAKNMISGMTNLDPAARTTMKEVLKHEWW